MTTEVQHDTYDRQGAASLKTKVYGTEKVSLIMFIGDEAPECLLYDSGVPSERKIIIWLHTSDQCVMI